MMWTKGNGISDDVRSYFERRAVVFRTPYGRISDAVRSYFGYGTVVFRNTDARISPPPARLGGRAPNRPRPPILGARAAELFFVHTIVFFCFFLSFHWFCKIFEFNALDS